jgi:hypothetical protein
LTIFLRSKRQEHDKLIPKIIDHVIFKVTSRVDRGFKFSRTVFPKESWSNEIFVNMDYKDLSNLNAMDFKIQVSIYIKDHTVPIGLKTVHDY